MVHLPAAVQYAREINAALSGSASGRPADWSCPFEIWGSDWAILGNWCCPFMFF